MTAFGYTGGGHTYEGHAERLSSKGASHVFGHWDDIAREILVAA
jgi:hypothetical protein